MWLYNVEDLFEKEYDLFETDYPKALKKYLKN